MKNFKELAEVALAAKQVFLPNRYGEPFVAAFQEVTGIEVPAVTGRKVSATSDGRTFTLARGRNIPNIVLRFSEKKPREPVVGLTGTEWCLENAPLNVAWEKMVEDRMGQLALIAPPNVVLGTPEATKRLPVVTPFPRIVSSLGRLCDYSLSPDLVVDGGVEGVAAHLDMAAVDLVGSGRTLLENNFRIVAGLIPVYPELVWPKPDIDNMVNGRME